ncbi:MAG: hypothetical protein M3460_18850 [Actinomycetota bacterium]|nr:hypothetical protein [Actinomycetota bacterium]
MTDPAAGVAANGLGTDSAPSEDAVENPREGVDGPREGTVEGPALVPERALSGERFGPPPPRLRVPGQVPELKPDTAMQKVVLPGLVELTLGNVVVPGRFDPHRIAGFVMRLEDVPASSASELVRRFGLNEVAGWPVTDELYVLRFYAHSPQLYINPFERSVYQVDLVELPAGTELWRIDSRGDEQRVGAYLNRQVGWVSTGPAMLGPACWNRPPVPLRPTVRRGLVAQYHGGDFDADFGPRPGEVTLHPLPGKRPPEELIKQAGGYPLPAMIDDLDSLDLVRWRGGWNGLPVELVEAGPEQAVIHYIGENGPRAADLGLAEVDYRVWRGCVPRSELADVQEQRVALLP